MDNIKRNEQILALFCRAEGISEISYQSLKEAGFNFGLSTDEKSYDGNRFTGLNDYYYHVRNDKTVLICKSI